jgi:transcriptional regulator with XRE-family HTH domain
MINSSKALKKSISKRIKIFRNKLNLTQKDLSQQLGMKITSISTIEVEKQLPTIPFIIGVYKTYKLSPIWLLTGEGEMIQILEPSEDNKIDYFKKAFPGVPVEPELIKMIDSLSVPILKNALILKYLELKNFYRSQIEGYEKEKARAFSSKGSGD